MKRSVTAKRPIELHERPFCNFIHRICNQPRLEGYDYCIRHILEDKNAPFRQCSYTHPANRKRCNNAASKNEKRDSLCPFHSKRAQVSKTVPTKRKHLEGPTGVLAHLKPYSLDPHHNRSYDRQAVHKGRRDSIPVNTPLSDLKHIGSVSGNDHNTLLNQTTVVAFDDDSESADSDPDDVLKHAGVFTQKEALRMYTNKIMRLRISYQEQLKRLEHALHEERKMYLQELQLERETYGNVSLEESFQGDLSSYEKFKADENYHRLHGTEALLHRESFFRRTGIRLKAPTQTFCSFSDDGKKCYQKAVVLTHFCVRHILSDPKQLLFKLCAGRDDKMNCRRPVIPYGDSHHCISHSQYTNIQEDKVEMGAHAEASTSADPIVEQEHFQSMDDIASLALDVLTPCSLFGLDEFGEPGESTDTVPSEDQEDLMQIEPITLNPPENILSESGKPEYEADK